MNPDLPGSEFNTPGKLPHCAAALHKRALAQESGRLDSILDFLLTIQPQKYLSPSLSYSCLLCQVRPLCFLPTCMFFVLRTKDLCSRESETKGQQFDPGGQIPISHEYSLIVRILLRYMENCPGLFPIKARNTLNALLPLFVLPSLFKIHLMS